MLGSVHSPLLLSGFLNLCQTPVFARPVLDVTRAPGTGCPFRLLLLGWPVMNPGITSPDHPFARSCPCSLPPRLGREEGQPVVYKTPEPTPR